MSVKPIPDGFHALTPYLFTQGAERLIEFISAAFDGELTSRETRPDGTIMHATMRVGDSMLMLADATPPFVANTCVAPMKEIFTRTSRISQPRFMKTHYGLS
jgi:uncharacterized glyoxalase superfamily protein PhnB